MKPNLSFSSSVEVKSAWSCTSTSPFCVNDTVLDSAEAQLHLAGIVFFLTLRGTTFHAMHDGDLKLMAVQIIQEVMLERWMCKDM